MFNFIVVLISDVNDLKYTIFPPLIVISMLRESLLKYYVIDIFNRLLDTTRFT